MNKKLLLTMSLAFFMAINSFSQSFYQWKRDRRITASLGIGAASYYGDLNDPGDIIDFTSNYTLGLEYKFHPRFDFRADLSYIKIAGKDTDLTENFNRNLSFRSNMYEFNFVSIANAFNDAGAYFERPGVNIHALAGIGLTYFNPKAQINDQGKYIALQPLNTEGADYSRLAFVIPFGVGVNFAITKELNLGIEGIFRLTFTDYLDDVSTVYPEVASFGGNPEAIALYDKRTDGQQGIPGKIRGNPEDNDSYFTISARLEYYLPDYIFNGAGNKRFRPRKNRNPRSKRFKKPKSGRRYLP